MNDSGQLDELNATEPVTDLDEVTVAVSVRPALCVTLVLGVESTVVVGAGPGGGPLLPLAPPPQPIAKLAMQTNPNPAAARIERLLPGIASSSSARIPASMLSLHHRISSIVRGRQFTGIVTALVVPDAAVVVIVSVAVAGTPLLSVTDAGEILHVAPGKPGMPLGMLLCGQLSATVLV